MIEAGKWYKTNPDKDGNTTIYYYVFMAKNDNAYCVSMFNGGEIFGYEICSNFVYDEEADVLPPHNKIELCRGAIASLFEQFGEYAGVLI